MEMYVWKKDYELVHKQRAEFKKKEKRVFPIILGQRSPSLRLQLKGAKLFEETYEKNDVVELLKIICSFCCKHDINNDKYYAILNSLRLLFINFQSVEMTNDDYLKEVQGRMATLDDYNANIVDLLSCLLEGRVREQYNKDLANATDERNKNLKKYVLKRGSATLLLIGADQGCCASLKNQLQ